VSFSRAKGVYGGLNLDGAVVHSNVGWNNASYGGSNVTPPDIQIRGSSRSAKSSALLCEVTRATR
jgi:lipid-binding SYLF domain-containing protein